MPKNQETTPSIAELLDSDITLEALAQQIRRTTEHLNALTALHAYLLRRSAVAVTKTTMTVTHNGSNATLCVNPGVTPPADASQLQLSKPTGSDVSLSPVEPQLPTPVKPVVPVRRQATGDELQAAADRVSTYLAAQPAGAGYNEIRSACRVSPAMFACIISQVQGVIVRNPVTKLYTYVPPIKPPVEPIP